MEERDHVFCCAHHHYMLTPKRYHSFWTFSGGQRERGGRPAAGQSGDTTIITQDAISATGEFWRPCVHRCWTRENGRSIGPP
jgi:hypothetical protein